MSQYNIDILSLYVSPSDGGSSNVVKRVDWRMTLTDGSYSTDFYKDTYFTNFDINNFTDYDQLNNNLIIEWIKSVEDMDSIKDELSSKLEKVKDPTTVVEKALPWIPEGEYLLETKYCLFKGEELLVGPIHWTSDVFNRTLESIGLQPSLPEDNLCFQRRLVPIKQPLVIDEESNVRIAVTEVTNEQPEESIYSNGVIVWDFNEWPYEGTYQLVSKSIDETKKLLIEDIIFNREIKEKKPFIVNINNNTINVDMTPYKRFLLVEQIASIDDSDTSFYIDFDGATFSLTKSELKFLLDQIVDKLNQLVAWQIEKIEFVNNANDVNDLRSLSEEIE